MRRRSCWLYFAPIVPGQRPLPWTVILDRRCSCRADRTAKVWVRPGWVPSAQDGIVRHRRSGAGKRFPAVRKPDPRGPSSVAPGVSASGAAHASVAIVVAMRRVGAAARPCAGRDQCMVPGGARCRTSTRTARRHAAVPAARMPAWAGGTPPTATGPGWGGDAAKARGAWPRPTRMRRSAARPVVAAWPRAAARTWRSTG